jgi:hypothetical protein
MALFSSMMAAAGRPDWSNGGVAATEAEGPSSLFESHARSILEPLSSFLIAWRRPLSLFLRDAAGRSILSPSPFESHDESFVLGTGWSNTSLRGLPRVPVRSALRLLLTPAWAEAVTRSALRARTHSNSNRTPLVAAGAAPPHPQTAAERFFAPLCSNSARTRRLAMGAALRAARAAGWAEAARGGESAAPVPHVFDSNAGVRVFDSNAGGEEAWRDALPEGCGVQSMALAERDSLLVVGTSAGTLLCVCDPRPPQPPGRGGEL